MKNLKSPPILLIILMAVGTQTASKAEHWPTWRGPDRMGVVSEGNPPLKWSETENIKWKVKLNGDASNSSPIIWGDKIFFQTAVDTKIKDDTPVAASIPNPHMRMSGGGMGHPGEEARGPRQPGRPGQPARPAQPGRPRQPRRPDQPGRPGAPGGRPSSRGSRGGGFGRSMSPPSTQYQFNLVCLDRKTGSTLWEETVCQVKPHQGHHGDHGFASFSPVTDGKYVWASYGSRGIYCYDVNGKKIWSKELPQMRTMFGEGGAPCIAGNAVIVLCDHSGDSTVFAFNKKTGEILWKKTRDEATSYATPLPITVDGKLQVIISATNRVRSYDAQTGDVIWECGGQTRNVIPTPVVGHGMIYCTSGFRGSALQAITLGKTGDLTDTDAVVWTAKRDTPYVPSPLLYDGRLYVCSVNKEVISCYNAKTGNPLFTKQTLDGLKGVYASPTAAAGRIYFVGRNGVTSVLKASDSLEVLATNTLNDEIDCSPAFIGNEMYLKGKQYLYCIAR